MRQIIEKLRTSKLNKWQNIALDILENKFESAKVEHTVKIDDFDNKIKQVGLSFEKFQELCELQFNKRKNANKIENWGCWMDIRVKFTLSEKQCNLIRRNIRSDYDSNYNEHLFNDNLPLFGNYYLQSKITLFTPKRGNPYNIVEGSVFYSKEKSKYKIIK